MSSPAPTTTSAPDTPPARAFPRRAANAARVLIALLVAAALLSNAMDAVAEGTLARNVSYFTNQSNAAFAVVLLVVALRGPSRPGRPSRPAVLDDVRGAVTFYLVMTGIIYALLVAPLSELGQWDIGWTGTVLHRLAPVAALLDWVLTPRQHRARPIRVLAWLAYPVMFLALTWIRGGITGWYPYGFLDPTLSGWGTVGATTAVVLVAFLLFAGLVHLIGGRLRRPGGRRRLDAARSDAAGVDATRSDAAPSDAAGFDSTR